MSCTHTDQIVDVTPGTPDGCQECLESGSWWVHLRICLTCGHVGCCDNSPNQHATRHYRASKHPIIQSYESGENWVYCYPDDELLPRRPKSWQQ